MTHLQKGDLAPDFEALDHEGQTARLADFRGRRLALYFYPADDTPSCTAEACSIRDHFSELSKMGVEIVGVSPDGLRKHQNFRKKHSLPFRLLSDPEAVLMKKYGVWGPKKLFGLEYDGVRRTTFLIDEAGKIAAVIEKVKSADHARQIVEGFSAA